MPQVRWHLITRIGFRFAVVYFGLFCLLFAQISFAFAGIVGRWLPQSAVAWQLYALDPVLHCSASSSRIRAR